MSQEPTMATAQFKFNMGDRALQLRMTVPVDPVPLQSLLPLLHQLENQFVGVAVQRVEEQGKKISCCAGCGACCRQLVPISEVEAQDIADLVELMPEPRRTEILRRFAEAHQKLAAAGLLERLQNRQGLPQESVDANGREYFFLGIPCPFLEDEACSIHPDRPLACREYLVTSSPEHCATLDYDQIDLVEMNPELWPAVAKTDPVRKGDTFIRWVPMILALDWARNRTTEPVERPGTEWIQEIISRAANPNIPTATVD